MLLGEFDGVKVKSRIKVGEELATSLFKNSLLNIDDRGAGLTDALSSSAIG